MTLSFSLSFVSGKNGKGWDVYMMKSVLSMVSVLWNPTPENGYKPAKSQALLFLTIALVMYMGPVNIGNFLYEMGVREQVTGNRYRGNELGQIIGLIVTFFGLRVMSFMFPEDWYKSRNSHGHRCLNLWQNLLYWGLFFAILVIYLM